MSSETILRGLLDIEAIKINIKEPFTWASGIKSPIYCDNRKALGRYDLRTDIVAKFIDIITNHFKNVDLIGGVATSGIPYATSIADKLKLPLVYFRSQLKSHGIKSGLEGDYNKGDKVVIVEDLISTGSSVLNAVDLARVSGLDVLGVVAIFSYELKVGISNFKKQNVELHTITGFSELYSMLDLSGDEKVFFEKWRESLNNSVAICI
jgi:orotate phosphoribosyltransferase